MASPVPLHPSQSEFLPVVFKHLEQKKNISLFLIYSDHSIKLKCVGGIGEMAFEADFLFPTIKADPCSNAYNPGKIQAPPERALPAGSGGWRDFQSPASQKEKDIQQHKLHIS